MARIEYTAAATDDGRALRAVLRGSMGLSASLVKAVKWQPDGILLDGRPARLNAVVHQGQAISVSASAHGPAPAGTRAGVGAPDMPPVLYEDDCLLVVNKPAGMAVHPTAGHLCGTLSDAAAAYLQDQPGAAFCPVSRLDRYTSGVLCAAKNRFTAQRLSAQLQNGQMHRIYRAVLCGDSLPDEGVVDAPIARVSGVRRAVSPDGQPAVTHWRVLRRGNGRSLVELWLQTGRTHQIRVHMAHAGFPVVGDFLYGTEDPDRPGFALHAQKLTLVHPLTTEQVTVSAAMPRWFDELLGI